MELLEAYKENPCRALSIPYWKHKHITIPPNMRIVHHNEYVRQAYQEYQDETYFRLYHGLGEIEKAALNGTSIVTAKREDIPTLVDIINQSYTDLSVTQEQLIGYTQTQVYEPNLWIMAVDAATSAVVGCAIADIDSQLREGIIEWVQVIPAYRRKGIGQLLVNELLRRMTDNADFATVSGKVNNATPPEKLYRKCGFVGSDIWHILTK